MVEKYSNSIVYLASLYILIQLWGELLLERANYQLMMRYIKNSKNLVVIMGLFRSEHQVNALNFLRKLFEIFAVKNALNFFLNYVTFLQVIQFEAFNVFKVFVANPDKSAGVISILYANKDKLIEFLTKMGKAAKDEGLFLHYLSILDQLDCSISRYFNFV